MTHPAPNSELTGEARKRLMGCADDDEAHWSLDPREGWAVDVPVADLRLILSAYDRQGEEIERLRGALDEVEPTARRYARCYPEASDGRNTFTMFADWAALLAARARQGGPDHG